MLKNTENGERTTPNKIAKQIMFDALDNCYYDIEEKWALMDSKPTEAEIKEIYRHIDKHRTAIGKKLGLL